MPINSQFNRETAGGPWFVAALLLVGLPGCGGDRHVSAAGTVTDRGTGVPHLFVTFEPVEHGESAWGTTDQKGHFLLQRPGGGRGVLPGKYRVWMEYRVPKPDPHTPILLGGFGPPPALRGVLARYARKASRLTVEISGPRDDLAIALE